MCAGNALSQIQRSPNEIPTPGMRRVHLSSLSGLSKDTQNIQDIAIALACPLEVESKSLLLKMTCILEIGPRGP